MYLKHLHIVLNVQEQTGERDKQIIHFQTQDWGHDGILGFRRRKSYQKKKKSWRPSVSKMGKLRPVSIRSVVGLVGSHRAKKWLRQNWNPTVRNARPALFTQRTPFYSLTMEAINFIWYHIFIIYLRIGKVLKQRPYEENKKSNITIKFLNTVLG